MGWGVGSGVGGRKTTLGHSGALLGGHTQSPPSNQTEETSFCSWEQLQPGNAQLVSSIGANVPVIVLQGYKSPPRKADPLNLAIADMVCGYLVYLLAGPIKCISILVRTRLVFAKIVTFLSKLLQYNSYHDNKSQKFDYCQYYMVHLNKHKFHHHDIPTCYHAPIVDEMIILCKV